MSIAELHQLSNAEKLKVIEVLWDDLADADAVISPDWHAVELKATEGRVKAGKEKLWDWNEAKDYLRSRK